MEVFSQLYQNNFFFFLIMTKKKEKPQIYRQTNHKKRETLREQDFFEPWWQKFSSQYFITQANESKIRLK